MPLDRLVGVQVAGRAVLVEERAARRVHPVAPVGPPAARAEALDSAAEVADRLGGLLERVPGPLAISGELTRIVHAGLVDEVEVEVEREGGHVTRDAPHEAVRLLAGGRVDEQLVHRTGVEVGRVEARSRRHVARVQDQARLREVRDVGAGDPEDVGGRSCGELGLELVLVRRALGVARLVGQVQPDVLGGDLVGDALVDVSLGLVVGSRPPPEVDGLGSRAGCLTGPRAGVSRWFTRRAGARAQGEGQPYGSHHPMT